ncbi:DUF3558 family protein [Nocardia sp. NBC_00511]|uniref:DUF3558 family protein n=1 Tax=Nocardia sp. NBC_00511 TaxID=2903591 RepID=UPI0030E25302
MNVRRRTQPAYPMIVALGVGACVLALLSGCDKSKDDATPSATLSSSVPTSFDPCHGIPADVLAAQHLNADPRPIPDNTGGPIDKYKGCDYTSQDAYQAERGPGITVRVTNVTMPYFVTNSQPQHQFQISGKDVATARAAGTNYCATLIAIHGGGIELSTSNSQADPCQVLVDLATGLAPTLPPN